MKDKCDICDETYDTKEGHSLEDCRRWELRKMQGRTDLWKSKTCEDCGYRVKYFCYYGPTRARAAEHYLDGDDAKKRFADACSKWEEKR